MTTVDDTKISVWEMESAIIGAITRTDQAGGTVKDMAHVATQVALDCVTPVLAARDAAHQSALDTLRWLHAEAVWHSEHHHAQAEQLAADKNIRQGALNGVLRRPASADYYEAIEAVADLVNERRLLTVRLEAEALPQALLRKGVRGLLDQVDAMARKIREQQAELAELRAEADYRAESFDDGPHGDCTDPPGLQCSDAGCPEHGDRDGVVDHDEDGEPESIDIEDFLDHVCGREGCGHRRGRHPLNGECVGAWAGDACSCTGFEEVSRA